MSESITPEQQRAWDNYQLALIASREFPEPDATHATGVVLHLPTPKSTARIHVDRVKGFRFAKGPNTRAWHGYRVGFWLIVWFGPLRDALANALAARLDRLNEVGAELGELMHVTGSSAGLRERARNEAHMAALKAEFTLTSLALRALEGGSLTWR